MASQGYATQLAIGAALNTVNTRLDFDDESLVCDETFNDTNGLRGTRSRDVSRNRRGIRRIGGSLNLQPNPVEWQGLLEWILGGSNTANTYALADALVSRVVQVDRVAKVYTYTGCKVDRATIRGTQGQPVSLVLDLVGMDETEGNAGTFPALTIDVSAGPFMFQEMVLSVNSANYATRDMEIVIDNHLDKERFFNSPTLTEVNPQDREIHVRTTPPHSEATALYNTGPGGVPVTATLTSGNAILTLSMVKVCFPRKSARTPGRSEIMLPLEGLAYKSGNTAELVTTLAIG